MFDPKSPDFVPGQEEVDRTSSFRMPQLSLTLDGFQNIPPAEITYTEEQIGKGNYSVVKSGKWFKKGIEQTVALKISSREHYVLFTHEVEILTVLRSVGTHPNVVTVHGTIDSPTKDILVMEYVPGLVLTDWLKNHPRTDLASFQTAYQLALGVLNGLKFLHANHIVHLDLKPDNVKLDAQGRPVILDFGFSVFIPEGQTTTRIYVPGGTVKYSAPEKFNIVGDDQVEISFQTDVYSYMLILLLCASKLGHEVNPQDNTLPKVMRRISSSTPAPIPPEVPAETKQLIVRGLSYRQADRQTAEEVYKVLDEEVKAGRLTV